MEHFEIVERIGRGAESTVYKVKVKSSSHVFPSLHPIQQEYFAMKYIPVRSVEQFNDALLEAQISVQLHHPHIVPCLEFFVTQKSTNLSETSSKKKSKKTAPNISDTEPSQWSVCLISEFCPKGTIKQFIQKLISNNKHLPEFLFWKWIKQVLEAIVFMHDECHLIHRDIKPENLFLDDKMNVKLGDLGFTKKLILDARASHSILGTHHFLAPELRSQSGKFSYTNALDIWCLGCVAIELVTQKRFDFAFELLKSQTTFFQHIPSHYSPNVTKFIQLMLQIDPTQRPSASELLNLINSFEKIPEPLNWQLFPFGKPQKTVADMLMDLDRDCYHIIFSFLQFKDVLNCSIVSKDWYASVETANFVWKLFLEREMGKPALQNLQNYKQAFVNQYQLETRWKNEECNRKVFSTFANEAILGLKIITQNSAFSLLQSKWSEQYETIGFVLAACETGNIRVFHLCKHSTQQPHLEIVHSFENSHVGPVWACDTNKSNIIASAGFDKKIILWDIKSKSKTYEFVDAHGKEIWDMNFVDNSTLVSGSGNGHIKLHDVVTQKEILDIENTSKGSIYATRSDYWNQFTNCIVAGGLRGQCAVFDTRSSSTMFDSFNFLNQERKQQANSIYEIEWKGNQLLTGNAEGDMDLWDLRFLKQPQQILRFNTNICSSGGCIRGLYFDGGYKIVAGSAHGQVHLVSIKDATPKIVHTYQKAFINSNQSRSAWAMSLAVNDTHMVASTHVGEVTVYDFGSKKSSVPTTNTSCTIN